MTLQSEEDLTALSEQLQAKIQTLDAIIHEQADALKAEAKEIAALKATIAELQKEGKGRK